MSGAGRILVVDDIAPNVRLLEAVLAPRGYDVVSATDGARALEREGVGAITTNCGFLVKFQRDGRNVVYSLADDHVYTMLNQGMSHICE